MTASTTTERGPRAKGWCAPDRPKPARGAARRAAGPALLIAALAPFVAAPRASAETLFAVTEGTSGQLLAIDTTNFSVSTIGGFTLAATSENSIGALRRHPDGTLYGISLTGTAQLYTLDPTSGAATPVGPLNAGFVFEGGLAIDPTDGQAYAVNGGSASSASLLRVDLATGQAAVVGKFPAGQHDFNDIVFDPSGQLWGFDEITDTLWRIDKQNPGLSTSFASLAPIDLGISGGAAFGADGVLYAYAEGSRELFTVDLTTGAATVIHTFPLSVPRLNGLARMADPCAYGDGCPGTGGLVPELSMGAECVVSGGAPIQLALTDGLGGAAALLLLGTQQGAASLGGGCTLLVQPVLPLVIPLTLSAAGSSFIATSAPFLPAPVTVTLQGFVVDPGGILGFAATNGVELTIQ